MSSNIKCLLILFLLAVTCSCRTSNRQIHSIKTPEQDKYNVVAYVAGWSAVPVSKMPADKLTHINYAFANLDSSGNVFFENLADRYKIDTLQQLKKINPDLKIIVSIGGWSWSKHFSDIAANQSLRNTFANNIASFITRYKLDGIDIDWEYPCMRGAGNSFRPEDKENFTQLLRTVRNTLSSLEIKQKRNEPYVLTIATGTSANYLKSIEPKKVLEYVDFIHIMTYDYRSGDSWETGHHSNLWTSLADWNHGNCIDKTIQRYVNAGIPSNKIIMGVPFYGRKWEGVTPKNNGLYQTAITAGLPISYRAIRKNCTPQVGYISLWDDAAQAPYLWNSKQQVFISYENPQSLRYKVDYIKQNKLNGIMFWEYTNDYNDELLNAIFNYLDNDRYSYKKQRDILLSVPYLLTSHSASNSVNNRHTFIPYMLPHAIYGLNDISVTFLLPFLNSLWFSRFLA